MTSALYPLLIKRIISNRTGKSEIIESSRDKLVSYIKLKYKMKDSNANEPLQPKVDIYDIISDIALAKITTNKKNMFFDYVQLAKIDGK